MDEPMNRTVSPLPFPIPRDGKNLTRVPGSNLVTFQTGMEMSHIADFYRQEFAEWGFQERTDLNAERLDFLRLVFENLQDGSMVVVQIMNLKYTMSIDMRYVNIYQEHQRIC